MGKLSSAIRQLRLKRSRKSLAHAIADDATSSLPAKRFRPDQPAINSNALLVDEEYQEKLQQLKEEWDGSRRTAVISFPRNIFRSLEILFRSLEIYFVPSKYILFPRNTFRSLEISIVPSKYTSSRRNPHRFPIKTCQQTGRNRPPKCRRIKEEIVNIFTGGGGGARRPSQSVAITRTIFRI